MPMNPIATSTTRRSLTPRQQELLALLQRVRYGRVHRLRVRAGEPDLAGGVEWTRTVKVGGDNGPHPSAPADDFALRRQVLDFFALLRDLGDGEVHDLEVRNGLPFAFDVKESLKELTTGCKESLQK